ncbi:MAG: polysaccharide deacetylase family protein [Pseudomonadota bacterium]
MTDSNARFGLTFDDGPSPAYTPALLDTLDRHGAKATFYAIGRNLELFPEVAREIISRGHQLGNHSHMHRGFAKLTVAQQLEELERTNELLCALTGNTHFKFRPPRGQLPPQLLLALGKRRQPIQMWTFDSRDYLKDANLVFDRFRQRHPRAGDVLLFHDDGPVAAQVLDELLPVWNLSGLSPVPA